MGRKTLGGQGRKTGDEAAGGNRPADLDDSRDSRSGPIGPPLSRETPPDDPGSPLGGKDGAGAPDVGAGTVGTGQINTFKPKVWGVGWPIFFDPIRGATQEGDPGTVGAGEAGGEVRETEVSIWARGLLDKPATEGADLTDSGADKTAAGTDDMGDVGLNEHTARFYARRTGSGFDPGTAGSRGVADGEPTLDAGRVGGGGPQELTARIWAHGITPPDREGEQDAPGPGFNRAGGDRTVGAHEGDGETNRFDGRITRQGLFGPPMDEWPLYGHRGDETADSSLQGAGPFRGPSAGDSAEVAGRTDTRLLELGAAETGEARVASANAHVGRAAMPPAVPVTAVQQAYGSQEVQAHPGLPFPRVDRRG